MPDDLPNVAAQTEQLSELPPVAEGVSAVASTARRQIFENLTHQLNNEDVTNPAAVKLIIDRMIIAEENRDSFKQFERLYYAEHEKAAVLTEKLRTNKMVEVFFGTGLALAGAAAGVAPLFWDKDHMLPGIICICYASVQLIISVLVRIFGTRQ
jgi:hypothetical protein